MRERGSGRGPGARRTRSARIAAAAALVGAILVATATGCASGADGTLPAGPAVTEAGPSTVFVTVGGVETLNSDRDDLADNWPQLVFGDKIPPGGSYVNVATEQATAASALGEQLPAIRDLHPGIVTIWLGSEDVTVGTPDAIFRMQLGDLVRGVQDAGATKVLLLDPLTDGSAADAAIAAARAEVAQETGATLVSLGSVTDRSDDVGQRHIADAVEAALG